ncbi:MAG: SDR family oxidoreductase [Acholeplasmataceae bacterium]|jgi:NAD(P)-dependent dehydrogenase (short-subunit alcohol dehydrogenase family)|nr:SDR family oxidoreductase [Acholeplasmataceae bacterium]
MKIPFKVNLKDKVVVITGGAGVLGSDFARAIAQCDAKVAILDLSLEKATELAGELTKQGYQAIGVKANVLDIASLKEARDEVIKTFGTCDILINGAGGNHPKATTTDEFFNKASFGTEGNKSFFDLDLESFNFVFGLNFSGTLLPTQIFGIDMVDKPGSVILNVSSMNAFTPLTKIPAYSAAKAAISNFTQWLAVHFAKSQIRVNAIAPGFFSTEQNKALLWNPDGTPSLRSKKILNQTPMGRYGEPHELIGTLLWLLDNEASGFVTGVVIPVDGGFSAYSGV